MALIKTMSDVTRILQLIEAGDPQAAPELLPLVYDELRKLAQQRLARENPGQTLQATALVHEAYLRLVGREAVAWNSRGHFFAAAAEAMRRILIDRARQRKAERHGGGLQRVELDEHNVQAPSRDEKLLQLDEALAKLDAENPKKAELVKLRYFGGLSNREASEMMGVSTATGERYWLFARAWLQREMSQ